MCHVMSHFFCRIATCWNELWLGVFGLCCPFVENGSMTNLHVWNGLKFARCEICFPWFLPIPDIFNLLPSWSAMIPHCRNLENIDFSRCTGEPLNSFIDLAFVAFRKGGGDSDWGTMIAVPGEEKLATTTMPSAQTSTGWMLCLFRCLGDSIKESLRCNTVRC